MYRRSFRWTLRLIVWSRSRWNVGFAQKLLWWPRIRYRGKLVGKYKVPETARKWTFLVYRRRRQTMFTAESLKFFCTARAWNDWYWIFVILTMSTPDLHIRPSLGGETYIQCTYMYFGNQFILKTGIPDSEISIRRLFISFHLLLAILTWSKNTENTINCIGRPAIHVPHYHSVCQILPLFELERPCPRLLAWFHSGLHCTTLVMKLRHLSFVISSAILDQPWSQTA